MGCPQAPHQLLAGVDATLPPQRGVLRDEPAQRGWESPRPLPFRECAMESHRWPASSTPALGCRVGRVASRFSQCLRRGIACLDQFAEAIQSNLDHADWNTRREILRAMVDRVVVEPDQIRIVYRINFPLFAKKASSDGSGGKTKIRQLCWRRDAAHPGCGSHKILSTLKG